MIYFKNLEISYITQNIFKYKKPDNKNKKKISTFRIKIKTNIKRSIFYANCIVYICLTLQDGISVKQQVCSELWITNPAMICYHRTAIWNRTCTNSPRVGR